MADMETSTSNRASGLCTRDLGRSAARLVIFICLTGGAHASDYVTLSKRLEAHDNYPAKDHGIGIIECDAGITPDCLKHLRTNSAGVAAVVGHSPEYWQSFWDFLAVAHDPPPIDYWAKSDEFPGSFSGVFVEAMIQWPLRDLIQNDQIHLEHLSQYVDQVHAAQQNSRLLADRSLFMSALLQIPGILNFAIAETAARHDPQRLAALLDLIRPLNPEEIQVANIFVGELAYADGKLAAGPQNASEQYQSALELNEELEAHGLATQPILMTDAEFEEQRAAWATERARIQTAIDAAQALDGLSDAEYWAKPVPTGTANAGLTYLTSIQEYLRAHNLHIAVLKALTDFYLGKATAPVPARTAPAHWRWYWRDAASELCLVPEGAILKASERGAAICLPHWTQAHLTPE